MIQIYTTPSCASCRKAKKWFDQYNIPYSEKNIFSIKLSKEDIFKMLANSENGFEDIISTRSKIFREKKLEPECMSVQALVSFIIEYPSVLKRPIIINENELQVGYNNEDITIFLPKELRNSEIFNSFSKGLDDEDEEDEDDYE
jgi:regulatory protein spx